MKKPKIKIWTNNVHFTSSNIQEMTYLQNNTVLQVEFIHGGTYNYLDVPVKVLQEVLAAESVTKKFNELIKNNYQTIKVS